MMQAIKVTAWLLLLATGGCATSFVGDAHFPGGPSGCSKHCDASGLAMDSFVYMGEYSSACVCRPKSAAPSASSASAAGASGGAAAGVVMAMRERERQQSESNAMTVRVY